MVSLAGYRYYRCLLLLVDECSDEGQKWANAQVHFYICVGEELGLFRTCLREPQSKLQRMHTHMYLSQL